MVGLLAGALGSGIGQAAGGVADIAKGYIDDERKVDLQRQFADIELEKQNRLDEARKSREYEYKLKENDPNGQFVTNEIASKKKGFTEVYNDKDVLKALANKDMAETVGDRATKGMRSGDSLAAEGALGKLDGRTKALVETYGKELATINNSIVKAQAENSWVSDSDNARSLLKRQADLNGKISALLGGGVGGGGKSAADFADQSEKPAADTSTPRSSRAEAAVETAPKMDLSTRRVFSAQGKDAAIASLQAEIGKYEKAQKDNPGEDLNYGPTIQKLRQQISAVQAVK